MAGFHLLTLLRIPVWVSPFYFLIPALCIASWGVGPGLVLTLGITVSVLAHELGHAFVAQKLGLEPQIMLHGLGGYTGHQRARTIGQDALIVAAGPLSGFGLGLSSFVLLPESQRSLGALFASYGSAGLVAGAPPWVSMLSVLALLNLVWSVINALPMIPLDGGRLFRLAMLKLMPRSIWAERITHGFGLLSAVLLAILTLNVPGFTSEPIALLLLALVALRNLQGLTMAQAPVRRDNPRARAWMSRAESAYREGEFELSARYCHMVRAEQNVAPQLIARTAALLGIMATRRGDFEEALSLLRRAPDAAEVVEATAQCFYQLHMYEALEALTRTQAFGRLPSDKRDEILFALRDVSA